MSSTYQNTVLFGDALQVFQPDLIAPCIKAGSQAGDLVLDPFIVSGTTGEVSQRLGRYYLGIDLNEEYEPMQKRRLSQQSFNFNDS